MSNAPDKQEPPPYQTETNLVAPSTALTVVQRAETALKMAERKTALAAMAQASTAITTITNNAGLQECHAARMRLKNERVGLEKLALDTRKEANAFATACIDAEKTLIGIIRPEEERLEAIQDAYTAEQDRIRQEVKNRERARQDAIQARIDELRDLGQEGRVKLRAVDVKVYLDKAMAIELAPANFDEHFERAALALEGTRKVLAETFEALVQHEAERAELKAQQALLAQQQKEQAAKEKANADRIAAIRAKMDYSAIVRLAVGCTSWQIDKILADKEQMPGPSEAMFEEFLPEAIAAWAAVSEALVKMHNDAIDSEYAAHAQAEERKRFAQEQEQQRLDRIELDRQKKEQSDRLAAEARTAELQRQEQDRLAQAQREEQTRLANEEAARVRAMARMESERVEQEKTDRAAEEKRRSADAVKDIVGKMQALIAKHQACSKVANLLTEIAANPNIAMQAQYRLGILEIVAELSTLAYPDRTPETPPVEPKARRTSSSSGPRATTTARKS